MVQRSGRLAYCFQEGSLRLVVGAVAAVCTAEVRTHSSLPMLGGARCKEVEVGRAIFRAELGAFSGTRAIMHAAGGSPRWRSARILPEVVYVTCR